MGLWKQSVTNCSRLCLRTSRHLNAHTGPDAEGVSVVREALEQLADSGAKAAVHGDDRVIAVEEDVHSRQPD